MTYCRTSLLVQVVSGGWRWVDDRRLFGQQVTEQRVMEIAALAVVRGDHLGLADGADRPPGPLDFDIPHAGEAHDGPEGIERGVLLEVELDMLEDSCPASPGRGNTRPPARPSSAAGAPGR